MWGSVAAGWEENADFVDERGADVTERLLALARLRPGDRVLELACGPGGVGLAAAPLVAPGGEVVLSDIAEEMTAIAQRRIEERGVPNATTRVLDLEAIDEPDASFDAVLCREGVMFAADHARAAGELARVLRPGGRVAIAVWGARERNPWLGVLLDSLSAQFGMPIPPAGIHGPFALSDAAELERLLAAAGLRDVRVEEFPAGYRTAGFEEWWTRTSALAGPVANLVRALPGEVQEEIEDRLRAAVIPYETAEGLDFEGMTLIASARR
jgi:ubiquinone/menaquinone biosynthesis C-methylase UbiE